MFSNQPRVLPLMRRTGSRHQRRGVLAALIVGLGLGRARPVAARCRRWVISGGPDPTDTIDVDDDLTVRRNGRVIFRDDEGGSSTLDPIRFTAENGDRLLITAIDTQADCHELSPLYLHCRSGGAPRKITDGVPLTCPNVAVGQFFRKQIKI